MLTEDERDRLARWMGWTYSGVKAPELRPCGVWTKNVDGTDFAANDADWLNPPTWEQAGILLDRAEEEGWWVQYTTPFYPGAAHNAGLTLHNTTGWNGRPDHVGQADTGPEAICRAVLAMLKNEEEQNVE